jgi:hypothetical protein
VRMSREWFTTDGRRRAGWPRRTMGILCGARRSTMLSTEMLEGPHTRTRRFRLRSWRISSMRVCVLPVCISD